MSAPGYSDEAITEGEARMIAMNERPEDDERWVPICARCLAEYDADVEATRRRLVVESREACWRSQAADLTAEAWPDD